MVGGSSTGKTRACWEALELLRGRPEKWRLWHPIDPSRPEAALRELPSLGPRTVIWLNEAQFYLDTPVDGQGEQVAAGLRELLRDPARAPVLVLATVWPAFWSQLTARPAADAIDSHAQARELLVGRDIAVPTAFTSTQLSLVAAADDPRLSLAAEVAKDGQVVQLLAGAPDLIDRYRNAPPPAAALIRAAIDARRLGVGTALPLAFLEEATPGYLTDAEWDALPENWLEQALAYISAPCKGVRGPLARIRPRVAAPAPGPAYRLADYLEQHGRHDRRQLIPPASFWRAAARFSGSGDLAALADAAEKRGLLRDAARLRKHAAERGNANEAATLVWDWHRLHPNSDDLKAAQWAAAHAALDNPYATARLLEALHDAGAHEQAASLLERDPAAQAAIDNPYATARLLDALQRVGAGDQIAALAARAATHVALDNPYATARLLDALQRVGAGDQIAALAARAATHVALDNPYATARLLDALQRVGAGDQIAALAARAATHVALDNPGSVTELLGALQETGAHEQAAALAARAAMHVALDNPYATARLLDALRLVGAGDQVAALAARAAAHVALDNPGDVADLLGALQEAGAHEQAAALAARAAMHVTLDNPGDVARLLDALQRVGAGEQVAALAARAAAHVALDDPFGVAWLLDALRLVGAGDQVAALAARAAAHVALDDPFGVARVLDVLRWAGAEEQVAALLARDPVPYVSLDNPGDVADLLGALQEAGAHEQAAALAARAAAHVALDNPGDVADLLGVLREVGAEDQFRTVIDRLPAEGHFGLFREQAGHQMPFRFGREPDGSPAPPWGWSDLDYPLAS